MKKKIGEVFSVTREIGAGTGYSYYLVRLTEGLALVDVCQIPSKQGVIGGLATQQFTFMCLQEGEAEIQLAKFRVFDMSSVLYEDVLLIKIEEGNKSATNRMGGWTDYHKPTPEEIEIFREAFNGFVGVNYEPLLVKSQLVNGVNYSYITNATGVYPGAEPYKAQVSIYKPFDEKAVITNIVRFLENELDAVRGFETE